MTEALADEESDTVTSFTAESAVATLEKAGICASDQVVLRQPADNAMIAVPSLGLVARIGVNTTHTARLDRELSLARWLAARGVPAVNPANRTPTPQLHVVDGRVITWWTYLPTTVHSTMSDLGRLLAQLHAQPRPWPDLPALDPWARVPQQLAAATKLPSHDLTALHTHWAELRDQWNDSRWPAAPSVVLHGDAYPGNTLVLDGTTYLLDFEDSRIGPPQWDIASVIGSRKVCWITNEEYAAFCRSYGADLRNEPDIDLLIEIVLFRRTCWYASRTGREPHVVPAVQHRISTLRDRRLVKRWSPG